MLIDEATTVSLEYFGYETVTYSAATFAQLPVEWDSTNEAVATVDNMGTVTLKACGTTTITAQRKNGVGNTISYVLHVIPIRQGTYFLRNLQTDMYADIEDNTASSGNNVVRESFDGSSSQKWRFTHIGNAVYTIRSESNISCYLGVSAGSVADDPGIVLYTGTVTDRMKWKIENGNEGYKIVSLLNPAYVLATKTSDDEPGELLIPGDWVDNNS